VQIYEVILGSQRSKVRMYVGHSGAKRGFMGLSVGQSGSKGRCTQVTVEQRVNVQGSQ
jgi:hypothetical protein